MFADTPTASTLTCNLTVMDVSTSMVCSIVPLKGGVAIYALSSFFVPVLSSGSASSVGPVGSASNLLTFTYTAATTTSVANVTDGRFSAWSVTVTGEFG